MSCRPTDPGSAQTPWRVDWRRMAGRAGRLAAHVTLIFVSVILTQNITIGDYPCMDNERCVANHVWGEGLPQCVHRCTVLLESLPSSPLTCITISTPFFKLRNLNALTFTVHMHRTIIESL